jgi:NADH-ubiquinone oxidoreductase chain 4
MILGHGLSSSGLFCALNIYYERRGSRSFYVNKGFVLLLPIFSLLFFLLCVSNIAAPPTMNLLAEIYLMGRVVGYDLLILILFPLGSFFGAVFRIFLFSYTQHGKSLNSVSNYIFVRLIELKSLLLHIIPLNVMVLKFEIFIL